MPTETIIFDELIEKNTPPEIEKQILSKRGFYWLEEKGLKILVCRRLQELGFPNGFSTRLGGVSAFPEDALNLAGFDEDSQENILENRRRFLDALSINFTLSTVWQVHSDQIKVINSLEQALNGNSKADAMISNLSEILLAIKTADCVPILLADPKQRTFAAIHAGWRGTLESITSKTIRKMEKIYGSTPRDLICALGPAAVSKYEVSSDVIEKFYEKFSEVAKSFFRPSQKEGHAFLNLHQANVNQLLDSGIMKENIFVAPFCTMQRTDLFFSYRIEKAKYGKVGRLLSVIGKLN
ncbi:MAG: peptidoglycan editing factor PgeF [Pyrinomonadaceae bacterium]|nr:peptidoglycan editing factor PgeF [Pyrinomonadaceae bacterium]MCX7640512.1 peptidoglycan editing factor PgeF [Pyrinomonadaceae bacterium]MDW8303907.1 peptidoglycan editing factor PgeF [Acidobacteriota bacterium]